MATQKNIQLYIQTDGVNDTPFYGSDCSGNINNGNGNTLITNCEQIEIGAFKYEAKRMGGLPTISFTLYHPESLEGLWNENIYGLFNGRKFFLKQTPSEKVSNDNLMYEYSVELVDERIILDNTYFFNAVAEGDTEEYDQPITNNTTFNFFGDINKFAKMLNSSLRYSKLQTVDNEGKKKGYVVIVDDGVVTEEKFVSFSKVFFSSAIQESYNTFEIPYYFVGKEIHIGYKAAEIAYPFQYGVDDAGLSISKQNANTRSINRATGTGSSENIPFYYPNKSPKGDLGVDVNTTSSDFSVTVKDNVKFADKVSVNDEIKAIYSSDIDYTITHGNLNGTTSVDYSTQIAYHKIQAEFEVIKGGQIEVMLDTIMQSVHSSATVNEPTMNNIDAKVIKYALYDSKSFVNNTRVFPIDEAEYNRAKLDDGTYINGKVVLKTPKSGKYIISAYQTFVDHNRANDVRITYNSTLSIRARDYMMIKNPQSRPVENWIVGDKIVALNDLGLDYSGTPKVGDTIRQKVLRYITPSDVLLPPKYRLTDGRERFYNALNDTYTIDGEHINFVKPYVDGKPRENIYENEGIKPSIIGATNAQGLRIDMFSEIAFDDGDNDETYNDEENGDVNYVHPYFFAKLRKLPFNLFDQALEDGGAMTIEFTSGRCGACKFEIAVDDESKENTVQVYESDTLVNGVLHPKGSLKYDENGRVICGVKKFQDAVTHRQEIQNDTINNEVWIALRKDDSTYGVLIPNAEANYKPSSCSSSDTNDGDTFIITNIKLPDEYIEAAEKRLEDYIIASMAKDNPEKFNFTIDLSRIFFEEHQELLSQLDENASIGMKMDGVIYSQFVSTYSYIMGENDILPEIKITLVDSLSVSTNAIQKIASQVNMNMLNALNSVNFMSLLSPYFLRKDQDDEAEGRVNFKRGLKFGEGGKIEIMPDNGAKLTIDYLEVNKKATFNALEIAESKHVGGQLLLTPAGMKCGEVEELDDAYRCYFQTKEGDSYKIFNQFVVGDQAICQTYNEYGSKYYWRLITAIGEDYIDLSKTDIDEESDIPEAGDTIVQLGNRDDISRQCAIVISTYDDTAPSIIMYHGINSFSLEGKNMTGIIWNPETKEPQTYSYGSFFFGDRELKNNFITFQKKEGDTDKNLYINGKVTIGAGSAGLSNLEEWSDKQTQINNAESTANKAKNDAANAQVTANDAKQKAEDAQSRAGVLESTTSNLSTQITDLENNVTDTVEEINKRLDGVVENYFEEGVPTLENYPANQWKTDDEKKNHIGDTYTNINTYEVDPENAGKSWRWVATDAEHSGYHWHPIADSDAVKALQDAAKAQSTADGKSTTFLRQPTNYSKGDLWVLQSDSDHTAGKKGEILTANTSSAAYNASHWSKEIIYTDDSKVNSFINGEFANYKTQIQSQIDKKAQTWYQSEDPSSSWTDKEKQEHIGDMWLNSSSITISGIESGMTAIWNGTEWKPSEVPQEVFNKIDGKAQVFVSIPTTPYRIGDLWASSDNRLMKCKTTRLTGTFVSSDWENADNSREYADAIGTEIHNTFDYLKAAMAQDTTIEGGLVQTSVLSLGYTDASGIRHVMSGTNGIYNPSLKGGGIAAWYGGLMVDREAPNAVIEGAATSLHRFDGSGYFAKGNISWDNEGAIDFAGGQLSITKHGALILGNDIAFGGDGDETIQTIISKLSTIMTWFQQYDENTIYTPFNLVTGRQIAAAQAGTASGGGTGSLIFTGPWSDYTSDKADYALAASLGYDLHSRVTTLEGKATNVSFAQSIAAGKQIGTISIDGKATNLYAPSSYAWGEITSKPTFASVATSGSYNDLSNKPTTLAGYGITNAIKLNVSPDYIGARFANGENAVGDKYLEWWNAAGWVHHKAGKYSVVDGTSSQFLKADGSLDNTAYLPLAGGGMTNNAVISGSNLRINGNRNNLYIGNENNDSNVCVVEDLCGPSVDSKKWYIFTTGEASFNKLSVGGTSVSLDGHTHTFSSLTSKPTTISGYGITDAYTKTEVNNALSGYLPLSGGTITGHITMSNSSIKMGYDVIEMGSGMLGAYTPSYPNTLFWYDGAGWQEVLHYGNYNSYAPTLTGTGASGTWGINISGNAATATRLQTARTIWGQSFDGTGNISGALSGVTNITANGSLKISKINISRDSFIGQYDEGIRIQATESQCCGVFLGTDSNDSGYIGSQWSLIKTNIDTFRIIRGASNNSLFEILNNGNVGIGTTSPEAKLHVVGGQIRCDDSILGYNTNAAFVWDKPGSYHTGVGSDGTTDTIRFGACYVDGTWTSYIQNWKFYGNIITTENITASGNVTIGNTLTVSGATILSSTLSVSGRATIAGGITSKGYHDLISAGNEFNFIPDSYSSEIYINWRTASGATNGAISEYKFCNGAATQYADIRCKNLYATGNTLTIGSATLTWNGSALVVDKPLVSTSFAAGATATASSSSGGGSFGPVRINVTALSGNATNVSQSTLDSYGLTATVIENMADGLYTKVVDTQNRASWTYEAEINGTWRAIWLRRGDTFDRNDGISMRSNDNGSTWTIIFNEI